MNQVLSNFGNKWIYSPIEFCCLFSQFLMVGIKGMLGSLKEQQWRRENRALICFLFSVELSCWRREPERWRPGNWVYVPLGAQRSVMGGTVALTKIVGWRNWLYCCFGWGMTMFWSEYEHLVAHLITVLESPLIVRPFINSNSKYKNINMFILSLSR
jgi:hypothetical protein